MGQESGHGLAGSSVQGLTELKSRFQLGQWSRMRLRVAGKIQFLAIVGQKFPPSCLLLTRECFQLLGASHSFLAHGPLHNVAACSCRTDRILSLFNSLCHSTRPIRSGPPWQQSPLGWTQTPPFRDFIYICTVPLPFNVTYLGVI